MDNIHLEKLTWDTVDDVLNLKVSKEQKEFVAPNRDSLIDAYFAMTEDKVSVFPFGCGEITLSYSGEVEYPASRLKLCSSKAVGISNIFKSDSVRVLIESGKALFIVNK